MSKYQPCPCWSRAPYSKCCRPYHIGKPAEDALKLMRSRYAAYALNLPQYIIDTTHPENSHYQENKDKWMQELHDFSNNIRFDGLKILSFQDGDTQAGVTFRAYLRQGEIDSSFTEQSKFIKMDDRWFYLSGVIEADKS